LLEGEVMTITDIIGYYPRFENVSSMEPTIEEMIYMYYRSYFEVEEALRLTDQYIEKIKEYAGENK
jgi:hypothetical protein